MPRLCRQPDKVCVLGRGVVSTEGTKDFSLRLNLCCSQNLTSGQEEAVLVQLIPQWSFLQPSLALWDTLHNFLGPLGTGLIVHEPCLHLRASAIPAPVPASRKLAVSELPASDMEEPARPPIEKPDLCSSQGFYCCKGTP